MARHEEILNLAAKRADLTHIQPDRRLINLLSGDAAQFEISGDEQKARLVDHLIRGKKRFEEELGKPISRPFLTSVFIMEAQHNHLIDLASTCTSGEDNEGFVVAFDFDRGVNSVLASIGGAEQVMEGAASDGIAVTLSEVSDHPMYSMKVEDQAQIFIRAMERVERFAGVLKKDPTGFTLIDYVTQDYQVHWSDFPSSNYLVKEIFMAGARKAGTMYKSIYPLTENLPTQQQA